MTITKYDCECCSETTYYIPLDKESLTMTDEGDIKYVLTRDEMQSLYFDLKEELLFNS